MRRRRRRWGRGLRRRQRRGCDGCDDNCTVTACGNGVRNRQRGLRRRQHHRRRLLLCELCGRSCRPGPCAGDGNGCTDDVCDGASFCGLANVAPCDDCSPCTGSDVCGGGACDGTSLCTACERCNEAVGCVVAPSGCISTFRKSTLAFSRDRLTWRAAAPRRRRAAPRRRPHALHVRRIGARRRDCCSPPTLAARPRAIRIANRAGTCPPGSTVPSSIATRPRRRTALLRFASFLIPPRGGCPSKSRRALSGLPLSFPLRVQLLTKHGCAEESYDGRDVVRNDASGFRATLRRR